MKVHRQTIHRHKVAAALLRAALNIAPAHAAEWGRAMLGELRHVEGDWSALMWAVGGASVLARQAFFSLFMRSNAQHIAPSGGEVFAKEKPMRKSTLIVAAACLAVCLLFFTAPAFRQAFQISLEQWSSLADAFHGSYRYAGPDLQKLTQQARQNHDAEGLAFAAMRCCGNESAQLAEEAVTLDPRLTWVYGVLGARNSFSQRDEWIPKLEAFDPQNALPHLMLASQIEWRQIGQHGAMNFEATADWQNAMAAAFASPKIDVYRDRVNQLDHEVAVRYGLSDPYEAQMEYFLSLSHVPGNSREYAKLLLANGDHLAARGDYEGAARQYLTVAHFGENSRASGDFLAVPILEDSYKRLAALCEKRGDQSQAQIFTARLADVERARQANIAANRDFVPRNRIEQRDAEILEFSGIGMILFGGLLFACAVIAIIHPRSGRFSTFRVTGRMTALAFGSGAGLVVSSVVLYLSYRPYAEIIRTYLRDGDRSHMRDLAFFVDHAETPLGAGSLYQMGDISMYFWYGVITMCAVALVFCTGKYFLQQRRAAAVV